jgi:hypothetical protein
VIVNIQRQPGANIISVVDRIKKLLPQLTATLPNRSEVTILTDRTNTIRASVERRAVRADADHRAGGDGDFPFCATWRPPSFPASRCRCRWWAPSA